MARLPVDSVDLAQKLEIIWSCTDRLQFFEEVLRSGRLGPNLYVPVKAELARQLAALDRRVLSCEFEEYGKPAMAGGNK